MSRHRSSARKDAKSAKEEHKENDRVLILFFAFFLGALCAFTRNWGMSTAPNLIPKKGLPNEQGRPG
jgi:hypothetical protein